MDKAAYNNTTTTSVMTRSGIEPSAIKTGPSPKKVINRKSMIKITIVKNFTMNHPLD